MRSNAEEAVLADMDEHRHSDLDDLFEALRQPGISKTGVGLQEMADWLCEYLERLGAQVHQEPGVTAPIVTGLVTGRGARKTLLFYDLYDVQPADEPGWASPPFEPTIMKGPDGRQRIVARGAFNSKGPLMGFLGVLRAFVRTGVPLPVDIRFVIEGEEEIGSPSLAPYLRTHAGELRECDAVLIPYFGTDGSGSTILRLGFKGLVLLEFSVEGGPWGGPVDGDVHAMHNAWLASPAWELVHALASLRLRDGTLAIDGIEARPLTPSPADAALLDEAARRFDAASWLADLGAQTFLYDDPRALLEHLMFDPTLNIQSLDTGWTRGKGDPPTVLPRTARAHVDLRLVPGMEVESTVRAIREHLDRRGFEHVQMSQGTSYNASKIDVHEPVVKSMITACRRHADDVVVYPLHAGAAPMSLFTDILGLPYAFGGLGHGGLSHAANEYITLDGLRDFKRSMASFLFAFAEA